MSERDFIKAGFLVVRREDTEVMYRGMDGLQWPLEEFESAWADLREELGIPQDIVLLDVPELATNWEAAHSYWQICLESGLRSDLLLVESRAGYADLEWPLRTQWELLGYDVTYLNGHYSAIYNEVREGRSLSSWMSELNENGLFHSLDQVERFLKERSILIKRGVGDVEDFGSVVPMRLWRFAGCEDAC